MRAYSISKILEEVVKGDDPGRGTDQTFVGEYFETMDFQHMSQTLLGEKVPVSRKVIVAPPSAGEESIVKALQIGCLDDEDALVLEQRVDPFADQGGVVYMLDQLEHDDGIEPLLLDLLL